MHKNDSAFGVLITFGIQLRGLKCSVWEENCLPFQILLQTYPGDW